MVKKIKVVAIIQARMNASRLQGKVLLDIAGKPMLWHVANRASRARLVDKVVIATTDDADGEKIAKFAKENGIDVFRGSEDNCLDRYYRAAKKFRANTVVRITADCPLICPEIIDRLVSEYLKGGFDYVTNILVYTYPDGCDVEAFSFKALERAWKECKDPVEKEHVTPYIKNSERFSIKNVENDHPVDPTRYKWSVDRREDLEFVRDVYKHLYKKKKRFSYKDIIRLLEQKPSLRLINSKSIVNEGYYRSILKSNKIPPRKLELRRSLSMKQEAKRFIPGCSQTFSKGPSQFVDGASPVFLEKGSGCRVWDVDGNEYIDYSMALGPIILGHNYPAVTHAVAKQLMFGTVFTLPHRLEIELSRLLCKIIPCAEMVRFGKNGSDATSGAIRVARAYAKRDLIVCSGYHGWQDWYIGTTSRDSGIPEAVKNLTLTFKYNDIHSLQRIFKAHPKRIAAVIMEPVGMVEPKDDFLKKVKELTHRHGAILIFDEIITGFRLAIGGAQEYFRVVPDIACFGKAMGNGFPISAVVGKSEIMKLFEEVFFSFTFGGDTASIVAAIATINELRTKNVIPHIWECGRRLRDGYNVLAREFGLERFTQCAGLPPRTVITFKKEKGEDDLILKSLFQQECIKRGILFTGSHNISFSHSNKDIIYTLKVYRTVLEIMKDAVAKKNTQQLLEGRAVEPVFRKA